MLMETSVFQIFAEIKEKDGEHLWHIFILRLDWNTSCNKQSFSEFLCSKQGRNVGIK
jgi:hypothetical protein